MTVAREKVLGVEVDPITIPDLVQVVSEHVREGRRLRVANHNMHSAYLVRDDPTMAAWYEQADVIFVDGMSLVAVSRLVRGNLQRAHRATVVDWLPQVLSLAARDGKRVFHLGGDPAWVDRAAEVWRADHPGLDVRTRHGFFAPDEVDSVVAEINAASPDLLLVGMGNPLQERWAATHADRLDVPVVVMVGAFMGFAGGAVPLPPRWVGQIGMEWAYRLATNPRHVARRYLVEPFGLLWGLARDRRAGRQPA